MGYPISPAFAANVQVAGKPNVPVIIQAFQRKVLTYTASNPDAFKVEFGNIGQHYYQWRYNGAGTATAPPTTSVPIGTVTTTATGATATTAASPTTGATTTTATTAASPTMASPSAAAGASGTPNPVSSPHP
jgi:hypothetical protein